MPRITQQMLRARLAEQLGMPQPAPIANLHSGYNGMNLLSIENDEMFLAEAYRRILGRKLDLDGMYHFLEVLKSHPRQVVIDALMAAGQSGSAAAQQKSQTGFVDLTDLDRLEADEFVREGYRRILGREGDSEGLAHYRELRYCGVPKVQVLGIIAASAEARQRNFHFLWHGSALPAPGRLGLAKRLQLLLCRLTGRSRLEDSLSSVGAEMRERYEALRDEVGALSTKLLNDNTSISRKCDAIAAEMQNANQLWTGKLREFASQIDILSGHMQKESAVATDRMLDLSARADVIAAMIRPPVLAGTDVLVTKVDNFVLAIPRDDWSMAAYYSFWGTLDQGLTRCLLTLTRPNMFVVDIGANIGLHTLQAARAVGERGRVYSFEPAPQAFDILRQNVKVSGFQCIELFPFAVLDRRGQVQLHLYQGASGLNTLFAESGSETSVLVEAMTLDEALLGREHVDIVKIDAEGAEPFIIRGMKRILAESPALVILLEFAPAHLQRAGVLPAEFLHELRAAGFGIQHVDDLTGELTTPTDEWLLNVKSSNLHLWRH
jgi:FkbM family methyltransferase